MQMPILRATRSPESQGPHQLPNSQLPGHFGVGKAPFANKKHSEEEERRKNLRKTHIAMGHPLEMKASYRDFIYKLSIFQPAKFDYQRVDDDDDDDDDELTVSSGISIYI